MSTFRADVRKYYNKKEPKEVDTTGRLPHWHQEKKMQFITFRLNDSLPQSVLDDYRRRKQLWLKEHPRPWDANTREEYERTFENRIDRWLDSNYGDCRLRERRIAAAFADILFDLSTDRFEVNAFVVMPNHVHLLITLVGEIRLDDVVKSVKGKSALILNRLLGRKGQFWERDYFDRIIRNEDHEENVRNYIHENATQGGVEYWTDRSTE